MENSKTITKEDNKDSKQLSRRDVLVDGGKLAVGIAGLGILSSLNIACKKKEDEAGVRKTKTIKGAGIADDTAALWPYKQVDGSTAAEQTYHNWFKDYCSYAVASAIIYQLRTSVGDPWTKFPLASIRWAHGGGVGWGTICGTLAGAATVIALISGKDGDAMINDLMNWYSTTALPTYTPVTQNTGGTPTSIQTKSNSPLCHVSTSTWMKKAGVTFFTPQRKDRCARLSANVTEKTVEMLNSYLAKGSYKGKNTVQLAPKGGKHTRPSQDKGVCNSCHDTML